MASIGNKIKEAATKAAKGHGGKKGKRRGHSESGLEKVKRAVKDRLR